MTTWDPGQYQRFARERARPFHELVARIPTDEAVAVVDLGCGPRAATPVLAPEVYVDVLSAAGLTVDAWETTYFHVLPGADPVLEWFTGTGLRPYLDALADDPVAVQEFRLAL